MSRAPTPTPSYGFLIDNRRCIGCHACTVACKAEHDVPVGVNRTWVKYVEKGTYPDTRRSFHVLRCNHCADAPCVAICPTGALFDRADGVVDFDTAACIACKACTHACPYDALYIDPDDHTAQKCNFCAHRIEQELLPSCVVVCPTTAIVAGDLNDPTTRIARLVRSEPTTVRKPHKGTRPRVYYVDGDADALVPGRASSADGHLWSAQELGVGIRQAVPQASTPDLVGLLATEEARAEAAAAARPREVYDAPDKGVLWGRKVTAYIVTKAVAAGVAGLASLYALTGWLELALAPHLLAALLLLAVTAGLLVADLGRPERFWMILTRGRAQSWLVRGTWVLLGLGTASGLLLLDAAGVLGLPPVLRSAVHVANGVAALLAAVYTAWLLGQCRGRDAWLRDDLAVRFALHAALVGLAYFFVVSDAAAVTAVPLAVALAGDLLLAELERRSAPATPDERAAHALGFTGDRARRYWLGVVLAGHVLPLALLPFGAATAPLVLVGVVVGLALHVDALVVEPQRVPLA